MMQRDDVRSCIRFWSVTTGYGRKEKKRSTLRLALPCLVVVQFGWIGAHHLYRTKRLF